MGSPKGEGEVRVAPGEDGLFQKREVLKLHLKSCSENSVPPLLSLQMGFLETPGSLQVHGGKGEGPDIIGHHGAGMPASLLVEAPTGFQSEGLSLSSHVLPPSFSCLVMLPRLQCIDKHLDFSIAFSYLWL